MVRKIQKLDPEWIDCDVTNFLNYQFDFGIVDVILTILVCDCVQCYGLTVFCKIVRPSNSFNQSTLENYYEFCFYLHGTVHVDK